MPVEFTIGRSDLNFKGGVVSKVLVTGAAGFIGSHVCLNLLERGDEVIGLDNVNDYYDVSLKEARLARLGVYSNFKFEKKDLADKESILGIFKSFKPSKVVNLAAQAGVRFSLQDPYTYINSNIMGFLNILEGCRHHGVEHLVYASSSSVYGSNTSMPFTVHDNVDHPLSLYAASKKSNELMAHTYSHLFGLPTTGLRFFSVYGPWGRPDMALFIFTKAILDGTPIDVYNCGKMKRDFTYVDDIVEGVVRVLDRNATPNPLWEAANPDPGTSNAPYRIYNIGNHSPVELMRFIELLEENLGKKAIKNMLPIQLGDVPESFANVDDLIQDTGFAPSTTIEIGIRQFVAWYKEYYQL